MKDYYGILGIPENASGDEIKRAFRELAFELHPDRNPSPEATERFKEIAEAYHVLSDGRKRAEYDAKKRMPGFDGAFSVDGFDVDRILRDMINAFRRPGGIDRRELENLKARIETARDALKEEGERIKQDKLREAGSRLEALIRTKDCYGLKRMAGDSDFEESTRIRAGNSAVELAKDPGFLMSLARDKEVPLPIQLQAGMRCVDGERDRWALQRISTSSDYPAEIRNAAGLRVVEQIKASHEFRSIATNRDFTPDVREEAGKKFVEVTSENWNLKSAAEDKDFPTTAREAAGLKYVQSLTLGYELKAAATDRDLPQPARQEAGTRYVVSLNADYELNAVARDKDYLQSTREAAARKLQENEIARAKKESFEPPAAGNGIGTLEGTKQQKRRW